MMTNRILILVVVLGTSVGSVVGPVGQRQKPCPAFNASTAQQDLIKGQPKLLLYGGIAPLRRAGDSVVEKQFGFLYQDLGCVRLVDDQCLRAYSQVVFAALDKKYGHRWRARVRQDVLFLRPLPY